MCSVLARRFQHSGSYDEISVFNSSSCLAPIMSFSKKKSFDHNLVNNLMLKISPSQNPACACLLHWLLTILIQIISTADIYNNLNPQSIYENF